MKIATILVAALVGSVGVAAKPAAAQERTVVRERVVTPATSSRVVVRERTTVHRETNYRRQPRRVCTVRYRHGNRIRTCRTMYGRY